MSDSKFDSESRMEGWRTRYARGGEESATRRWRAAAGANP
jgi:hypothetical protein